MRYQKIRPRIPDAHAERLDRMERASFAMMTGIVQLLNSREETGRPVVARAKQRPIQIAKRV